MVQFSGKTAPWEQGHVANLQNNLSIRSDFQKSLSEEAPGTPHAAFMRLWWAHRVEAENAIRSMKMAQSLAARESVCNHGDHSECSLLTHLNEFLPYSVLQLSPELRPWGVGDVETIGNNIKNK